ncbi:MAG: response regulator [Leptolyngbyaceae cyanobacterium bins.302]|nr:response regulator [Leptolyngbyaceae cyanobacterium bins.302]
MYRIAIVDDNEAWCYVLQTVLQQHDFTVLTFTDAHAFIKVAQQFDLALIDFSMPARPFARELDGCEVINQLKQTLKNPPFMVLTSAFFAQDTLAIARELCPKADAYLSKTTSVTKIVELITRTKSGKSSTAQNTPNHQTRLNQLITQGSNIGIA